MAVIASTRLPWADHARCFIVVKSVWPSDGQPVLRFRPVRWDYYSQRLEIISGELLPGEPIPLLKHRQELSRKEAVQLWSERRKEGWRTCPPQW